jgi:hypothetical protein
MNLAHDARIRYRIYLGVSWFEYGSAMKDYGEKIDGAGTRCANTVNVFLDGVGKWVKTWKMWKCTGLGVDDECTVIMC